VRDALPSLKSVITQDMSYTLLVKGAAIDASASERLMPVSAYLSAAQSLAPSPHIPIIVLRISCSKSIKRDLSSGDILA